MGLFPLENPIRSYAWGSHTVLADLAGRPSPTARSALRLFAKNSAPEYSTGVTTLPRFFGNPFAIEPSRGQLSGDAGLLPLRRFDERGGLTRCFSHIGPPPRDRLGMSHRGHRGSA